jgi:hypothetical protein
MQRCRATRLVAVGMLVVFAALFPALASADSDSLRAVPFVFIGNAGDCGPGTFGSHIVTAAWLGGMGLPDQGGDTALNGVAATADDPHRGLLLSKNGPSPDCSSAGARITGVKRMTAVETFTLGFDYRNGGHCGAGAPRFNVVASPPTGPNTFHFVGGCANAVSTPAPQDPAQWSRVRFTAAQQFPPITPRSRIVSITLLYDEGTDTPSTQDPNGVGLAVVDNIFINGAFIRTGRGIADGRTGEDRGDKRDDGGRGDDED